MNRLSVSIFLVAAFAIIALAGRQANSGSNPYSVIVANCPSQPVPVKPVGTVATTVVNEPNVHAFVTNSSAAPVPVTQTDRDMFRQFFEIGLVGNVGFANYSVPNNKNLIIDWIGVSSKADTANAYATDVEIDIGYPSTIGGQIDVPLAPNVLRNDYATGMASMHVLVQHGESLHIYPGRTTTSGQASASVTIVGHFVPIS